MAGIVKFEKAVVVAGMVDCMRNNAMDGGHRQSIPWQLMTEKNFKSFDQFERGNWKEWSFQFKVALRASSTKACELATEAEQLTRPITMEAGNLDVGVDDMSADRIGAELYDVLAMIVKGEPCAAIRRVSGRSGLGAWRWLRPKTKPSTPWRRVVP